METNRKIVFGLGNTDRVMLELAKLREKLHMVGAQPVDFSVGVELSDGTKNVMPETLDRTEAVLCSWGMLEV